MIQCKNLSFGYRKQPVYETFNWELPLESGSIYGLLGPNGAGKTTLFRMLTGLIFQREGAISVLGFEPKKREESFYKKITYISEDLQCPDMSPLDYINICGPLYPNFSKELFHDLCEKFEIDAEKGFSHYSSGDLRKAWLCIVLSCQTEIVFLDEPSKGLDINAQAVLRKVLAQSADAGSRIILSTHHVREVEGLLDHVTIIDRGGKLRLNSSVTGLSEEFSLVHCLTKEQLPADALSYQRTTSGWTALMRQPAEEEEDISLELLFTGLCKKAEVPANE
ncbi:ABC-2 type transport system ATP-binding protein [Natronobacillus azotifigens]|uniref:ATP-binding cassette domain-containing protein n=1 Tax=Natronobacillus azotifigens TaxID=472978 RepID=A0A9J6RGQ5_9BACI|nr:ATP-binding cassette domain-containing protein [Natronobacillus azotifigens]MCZ0704630.1 ATP-binding cassette domain-containing protein [Natronobacillus azotifigens]